MSAQDVKAGIVGRLSTVFGSLAFLATLSAAPAAAQISESVTIANNLGTGFDPTKTPVASAGGSIETRYLGNYTPTTQSELGLNYTATADDGGFFFLHDNYCVGRCTTISDTTIAFTVTNTNDGLENIRFDSQITPGHLAKIYNGSATAGFNFEVLKIFNGDAQSLYSASGTVGSRGIFLDTGNLQFNGLRFLEGANFQLLDWSATNLSIDVGELSGFQSMQVVYRASYWSINDSDCADVFTCNGAQVVFGDPRNNGGTNLRSAFNTAADPGRAVIGGDYDATFVPFAFVRSDAPPSFTQPTPGAPLVYDPLYRSRGAVPEPASWALMILGFGAAGSAVRRKRGRLQLA